MCKHRGTLRENKMDKLSQKKENTDVEENSFALAVSLTEIFHLKHYLFHTDVICRMLVSSSVSRLRALLARPANSESATAPSPPYITCCPLLEVVLTN